MDLVEFFSSHEAYLDEHLMGLHHHKVATLVTPKKLDCFRPFSNEYLDTKNELAFYPGTVLPPCADGTPLEHPVGSKSEEFIDVPDHV